MMDVTSPVTGKLTACNGPRGLGVSQLIGSLRDRLPNLAYLPNLLAGIGSLGNGSATMLMTSLAALSIGSLRDRLPNLA